MAFSGRISRHLSGFEECCLEPEGRVVRALGIDVVFDHFHAGLSCRMLLSGVPRTNPQPGVLYLAQLQAFPLAGRDYGARTGPAAELENQGLFLKAGPTQQNRADLTRLALIG